ncbi:MAG: SCO family protein [Desulfobulbaceae bacterium]|nr:MAG: SCO family protein [Desulfobulbaceae bacterium]
MRCSFTTENSMSTIVNSGWRIGLIITISMALAVTGAFLLRKPVLHIDVPGARILSPPVRVPPFSLLDQKGQLFSNERLAGNWTLATVGFTYCPDICPTTLSEMSAVFKKMETVSGAFKMPRFVFFSVDPFRDTPEVLEKYLAYFRRDFIGVTGAPEAIQSFANELGLHYVYSDPEDGQLVDGVLQKPAIEDYAVIHATSVVFITPTGEMVATMAPPFKTDEVVSVFEKLRTHYGN